MMAKYGFFTLTFLVIANMIGAGVFTTSGFALADLGSPRLVILAWIVGGVIAVSGAVSYGMLSRLMPESGGEYLFLSQAAHPLLGFIAGWVSILAGFSGAIALAAVALESYVRPGAARPEWLPANCLAAVAVVLAGWLHGLQPRLGAITQNLAVIVKLILFAAILIFAGFQMAGDSTTLYVEGFSGNQALSPPVSLILAFASSLVWISLSYSGFNAAVYLAGEVRDAERIVPRALVTGTVGVAIIYILLNAVFVLGPSVAQVVGRPDIAAVAARELGGWWFEEMVRWTIVLCLTTSVLSMMMAAPRVYARMAQDGLLPGSLKLRGHSPALATTVQVFIAIVLLVLSNLQGLLSYLGLTLSLSAALSVACLLLPSMQRQWRLKVGPTTFIYYLVPLLYILSTLICAAMLAYRSPEQILGSVVTFSIGAVVYLLSGRSGLRRKPVA